MVVVGIIATLSVLAIGTWRATERADRIENGAQQVVNMLEGGRQRAAMLGMPVGVRLTLAYPDREDAGATGVPTNVQLSAAGTLGGRVVQEMLYVGATDPFVGTLNVHYRNPVDVNGWDQSSSVAPPITTLANPRWCIDDASIIDPTAQTTEPWLILSPSTYTYQATPGGGATTINNAYENLTATVPQVPRGVLQPGSRIEIPAFSGEWYTISPYGFDPDADVMTLVEEYAETQSFEVPFGGSFIRVPRAAQARNVTFRLDLGLAPLPQFRPVTLPEGVAIDLDGSELPQPFSPSDTNPTGWGAPGPATSYSNTIDLVFSPSGGLTTTQSTSGVVKLLVTTMDDCVRVRRAIDPTSMTPTHPQSAAIAAGTASARNTAGGNLPFAVGGQGTATGDPVGATDERRVIAVFAQTGQVASYQVDTSDLVQNRNGMAGADGLADLPFRNIGSRGGER